MSRVLDILALLLLAVVVLAAADIETLAGESFAGVTILEETADRIRFELQEGREKMAIALPMAAIHRIRDAAGGPWRVLNAKPEPVVPPPVPLVQAPPPPPPPPTNVGQRAMWRNDSTGHFPGNDAPVTWSATENVRWRTPLPNWGSGSPVVVGDVAICCAEPHTVLCLGRVDGAIRWQTANPPSEALGAGHEDPPVREPKGLRGWTCATPAVDEHRAYVAFGFGMIAAFDLADGKRVWAIPMDTGSQWGPDLTASPLLYQDLILQQTNTVHAIEAATGKTRWTAGGGTGLHGTPAFMDLGGEMHLVQTHGQLIRVRDGRMVVAGRVEKPWQNWGPSVAVAGDVAVLHLHGKPKNMTMLRAYRYGADGTQTKLWDFVPEAEPTYFTRMGNSHLIHDGLVYAVTDGGHLTVIDLATGALVYEHRWAKNAYSSMAMAGPSIFITGKEQMHILAPGRELKVVADFDHGFARHEAPPWVTISSPFFAADALFFRDRTHLWCIGK